MSHPLKDYVRAVQDELARDGERPKYTWTLRQVEHWYEHAKALASLDIGGPKVSGRREHKAATIVRLVEAIRPKTKEGA